MNEDATRDFNLWKLNWTSSLERTVAGALGIDLVDMNDESITLRMPISDATRQPMGLLHGGVSMVLVETAASMHACWGVDLTERYPVGIEINGSHVGSAQEGDVVATGTVVRRGRTLIVHEVRIVHEQTGKLLNVSRITNMYVPTGR